jgi:hypothetical protein
VNISDAQNAQIFLNWLLGGQPTEPTDARRAQQARQAAQELADRSHRALQAGWTATTVAEAWPRLEGPQHAQHADHALGFLDSPTRAQLLHQISGDNAPTGPDPVRYPNEGEDQ